MSNNGVITVVVPDNTVELQTPFHVNPSGGTAVTEDEVAKAVSHILGVAFTQPGERVMRPTLGVGIQRLVFQDDVPAQFAAAASAMQSAYAKFDGGLMVASVTVKQAYDGTWNFNVSFTIDQSPVVHQAVFDYQGDLVGFS